MTNTETPTRFEIPIRVDIEAETPDFQRAMGRLDQAATKELDRADIDHRLRELVRIRASQLNGCAYCVDMHTKDARAVGETDERLAGIAVWRETPFFSARERAALAFTESLTRLSDTHVPDEDYAAVATEFESTEIAALITLIVTINAWNGLSVSSRAWTPGSYQI